ncbi:MAG: putative peptide methionine sulfoxide reductase [Frankiales bacterium]|jgi:peptide-methionine (S)-S-oxide reductase|nr:putative peptide methionine sulfoxide reductase [Frankiales bacterium]
MWTVGRKTELVSPDEALKGRDDAMRVPDKHTVLGTPLTGPWPAGLEIAYFGMGCFWGAERFFWQLDGVYSTSVGYQGGHTPNPTYEETCTGRTGHTEAVQVVYDPAKVSYETLLKTFWENHDSTQGMRQGNDVGTQYRSAVYTTSDAQLETAKASRVTYQDALTKAGRGTISTEILPAGPFYYAETYHQQYLDKNPNGYCNHGFNGVSCPIGLNVPAQIDVAPPRS